MSEEHEAWGELLIWHINGTLEESRRALVETHLRGCRACRRELIAWERVSAAVRSQPAAPLPWATRRRLLLALAQPQRWSKARFAAQLLHSQLRVVRGEIWPASALVLALGTLVTLASRELGSEALPFVLTAPVVAATGIGFLYGPAVDPALELELATPTSPRLVLLARLALVFGFDLALGLTGSLALTTLGSAMPFWPLVGAWLAPMAFLSGLSLLLSILCSDPGAGVLASVGLWGVQVAYETGALDGRLQLPDLTAQAVRPSLWALALLMVGLAVWVGGREERWLGRRA